MKIAIVTGASSGMGREFVLQLTAHVQVDEIWVVARRREALEALQAHCAVTVRPVVLDLCKQESFQAYADLLEAEKPDVKLLVNAAGFGKFGSYSKISLADDLAMIDLNCKALVAMTRLTLPYMAKGSHILQLDSLSAFQPVPYHHLRCNQVLRAQLQPCHECRAQGHRYPHDGHESRLGKDGIFQPRHADQRWRGAVLRPAVRGKGCGSYRP